MAINSTFYLDAADLTLATSVYLDSSLLNLAPDGFYSDGTISREQSSGILLTAETCTSCSDCTCYELSSIPSEIGIDNTEFDYIDCFTDEAASIIVFVDNAVNICAKTGSVTEGAGNPGTIGPPLTDCCTLTCQCYTVTWLQPTTEPWFGFTNFDYKNCAGTIIEATVSEFGPPMNICAQVGYSIRINTSTPNDESIDVSDAVEDCCYIPLALRSDPGTEEEFKETVCSLPFVINDIYIIVNGGGTVIQSGDIVCNSTDPNDRFNGGNLYYNLQISYVIEGEPSYNCQVDEDGIISVYSTCLIPPPT